MNRRASSPHCVAGKATWEVVCSKLLAQQWSLLPAEKSVGPSRGTRLGAKSGGSSVTRAGYTLASYYVCTPSQHSIPESKGAKREVGETLHVTVASCTPLSGVLPGIVSSRGKIGGNELIGCGKAMIL